MSGNVLLPTEIITYANLGGASYAQSLAPLGYEIIEPRINPDNGFSATAFRNIETGEIVISYRGTDDFKDMTQADIDLALQKLLINSMML